MDRTLEPINEAFRGLLVSLWPLWTLLGLVILFQIGLARSRQRRIANSGIHDIDEMTGHEFEIFLAHLLRRFGYTVKHTGKTGDFGADLVIEKDSMRTVVQAKRYKKSVGVKAIQEVVAARTMYQCRGAMVITNSTFTRQARALAESNDVKLWDRTRLIDVITRAGGED